MLSRAVGKGKWLPIEDGLINWDPEAGNNDPAGDLANVTLTLPTPPATQYYQQHQQPRVVSQNGIYPQHPHSATSNTHSMGLSTGRTIRAFPRRNASSAHQNGNGNGNGLSTPGMPMSASSNLGSARIMSVNMEGVYSPMPPTTANGVTYFNPPAPPMYGEDEVPMSVQLPSANLQAQQHQQQQQQGQVPMMSPMPQTAAMVMTPIPQATGWDNSSQTPIPSSTPAAESGDETETTPRGVKRSRSEEEADNDNQNNGFDGSGYEA